MPTRVSVARTLLLGGLGVVLLVLLSIPGGKTNGISQPAEHLPGQLAESVWQRFRESDSLGALAMLHFSSYVEIAKFDNLYKPYKVSPPESASDPALIADVRRIRRNEYERFESCHLEGFGQWERKLTPFVFGEQDLVDNWGQGLYSCGRLEIDFNGDNMIDF